MEQIIKLLESALQLERMATLTMTAIGGALVYVIVYKIPPMIAKTLESVSKSLERISVTMAELVITSTKICAETSSHTTGMTVHHENAIEIRGVVETLVEKVDHGNRTVERIETILNNRPCINR